MAAVSFPDQRADPVLAALWDNPKDAAYDKLAAITSNVARLLVGDYKIKAWRESGLLYPSIVTGIVRTIKHEMIAGKMGELPASELPAVEDKLREILAL